MPMSWGLLIVMLDCIYYNWTMICQTSTKITEELFDQFINFGFCSGLPIYLWHALNWFPIDRHAFNWFPIDRHAYNWHILTWIAFNQPQPGTLDTCQDFVKYYVCQNMPMSWGLLISMLDYIYYNWTMVCQTSAKITEELLDQFPTYCCHRWSFHMQHTKHNQTTLITLCCNHLC